MYQVSRRVNSTWGVEGYEVPKQYVDPLKQVKEREYIKNQKNKGQKDKRYVTKRGNFLDDLQKVSKGIPAPNEYKIVKKWTDDSKKGAKREKKEDKGDKDKKASGPGPGSYNLRKDYKKLMAELDELKKKKIKLIF